MTFQEFLATKRALAIVEHMETLSEADALELFEQLDDATVELIEQLLDEGKRPEGFGPASRNQPKDNESERKEQFFVKKSQQVKLTPEELASMDKFDKEYTKQKRAREAAEAAEKQKEADEYFYKAPKPRGRRNK
jgi:hypothetical protein